MRLGVVVHMTEDIFGREAGRRVAGAREEGEWRGRAAIPDSVFVGEAHGVGVVVDVGAVDSGGEEELAGGIDLGSREGKEMDAGGGAGGLVAVSGDELLCS